MERGVTLLQPHAEGNPSSTRWVFKNPHGNFTVHGGTNFCVGRTAAADDSFQKSTMARKWRLKGASAEVYPLASSSTLSDRVAATAMGEAEGARTCYICLSADGPFLVGLCACTWMSVHPACIRKQIAYDPSQSTTCGVCHETLRVEPPTSDLWLRHPYTALGSTLGTIALLALGFVSIAASLALLMSPESRRFAAPVGLAGSAVLLHSWNTMILLLRARPGDCLLHTVSSHPCRCGEIKLLATFVASCSYGPLVILLARLFTRSQGVVCVCVCVQTRCSTQRVADVGSQAVVLLVVIALLVSLLGFLLDPNQGGAGRTSTSGRG